MQRRQRPALLVLALSGLFGLVGSVLVPSAAVAAPANIGTVLDALIVQPENGAAAYNRDYFNHWVDADSDGCNTRAEVLIRSTAVPVAFSSGCTVATGSWTSPYDGVVWTAAGDVDIDHMVPLEEAWQSGAAAWTAAQRQAYANDLDYADSLVAVTDNVNQSKGARDPSEWLPPLASAKCEYLVDWAVVKWRWKLTVDQSEASALRGALLGECGNPAVELPTRGDVPEATAAPGPFIDVAMTHPFVNEITWMAGARLTTGYADGGFHPAATVTRQAFAAYLYRYTHAGAEPAPCTSQWFPDVPASSPFCGHITWLAGTGITTGYGNGTFGPNVAISRQAMAAFLQRYRAAASATPNTCNAAAFSDVADGPLCGAITWLQASGITTGYSDGTFRPVAPMTRQATAAYLFRFNTKFGPSNPPIVVSPPVVSPPVVSPPVVTNPGDAVNCSNFSTSWAAAQAWFDRYFASFGDVAHLDSDGDRIACETLPGAP